MSRRKSRTISVLGLTGLLVATLILSASATASSAEAVSVEPAVALGEVAEPVRPEVDEEDASSVADLVQRATPDQNGRANRPPYAHDARVLFEEMTLVQLLWEQTGYAKTLCAGNGLNNIQPLSESPIILIPNAGDLAAGGSNVSIHLSPDGEITFIPRVQGQRIMVPMDVGDKREGEEVLSLSFDEAMQLMAADKLVWTAKDQGPYRNGHGLPGHIAACDPSFDEAVYLEWEEQEGF